MRRSSEVSINGSQLPIRRAVFADEGRKLLEVLNTTDSSTDSAPAFLRGNKRGLSNRTLNINVQPPKTSKSMEKENDVNDVDRDGDQSESKDDKIQELLETVDVNSSRSPGVVPKMWTTEEDDKLRKAIKVNGERNWRRISEMVPGRSYIQCLQRWKKALMPGLIKGHWSAEEDEKLIELVHLQGGNEKGNKLDWQAISLEIDGRNAKQCKERWMQNLDPSIKKTSWSKEEDELLCRLVAEWGGKWALISKQIDGRTENAVKTRYNSILRTQLQNRDWDKSEDDEIVKVITAKGTTSASLDNLKKVLKNRTKGGIRKRAIWLESQLGLPPTIETKEPKKERRGSKISSTSSNQKPVASQFEFARMDSWSNSDAMARLQVGEGQDRIPYMRTPSAQILGHFIRDEEEKLGMRPIQQQNYSHNSNFNDRLGTLPEMYQPSVPQHYEYYQQWEPTTSSFQPDEMINVEAMLQEMPNDFGFPTDFVQLQNPANPQLESYHHPVHPSMYQQQQERPRFERSGTQGTKNSSGRSVMSLFAQTIPFQHATSEIHPGTDAKVRQQTLSNRLTSSAFKPVYNTESSNGRSRPVQVTSRNAEAGRYLLNQTL